MVVPTGRAAVICATAAALAVAPIRAVMELREAVVRTPASAQIHMLTVSSIPCSETHPTAKLTRTGSCRQVMPEPMGMTITVGTTVPAEFLQTRC
jgi:hypothetical protein